VGYFWKEKRHNTFINIGYYSHNFQREEEYQKVSFLSLRFLETKQKNGKNNTFIKDSGEMR
jgi:hypothetical protein